MCEQRRVRGASTASDNGEMSSPEADLLTGKRVAVAGICASAVLATLNLGVGLYVRSTAVVATGF